MPSRKELTARPAFMVPPIVLVPVSTHCGRQRSQRIIVGIVGGGVVVVSDGYVRGI